ncbi:MAG: RNA polymerase factor sigma-54 [Candidatus Delongbacteria bacterium]|nr:RNA polymerase factor sigma-54 [Candidatus Delongbacteria bacterium]
MLKHTLNTNLRLDTKLEPAVILRSEILALPILQLEAKIKQELAENPFLESDEFEIEDPNIDQIDDQPDIDVQEKTEDISIEEFISEFSNYEDNFPGQYNKDDDDNDFQQPFTKTLKDSLYDQLYQDSFLQDEIEIAQKIIDNLDECGFFRLELAEIADTFENISEEKVQTVLNKVQHLEPVGIAARSIQESLIIQLKSKKLYMQDTLTVLQDHFDDFMNNKMALIMDRTGISRDQMIEVIDEIKHLNPKPGLSRLMDPWEKYSDDNSAIVPDFIIQRIDGKLQVFLNSPSIQNLYVNENDAKIMLSNSAMDKKGKDFVRNKFEKAKWFINAIQQRRRTLKKVMYSILKFQDEFFEDGPEKLKPLILKDVAEDIGMDIATISRSTRGKYAYTEFGIFELKYFFTEKIHTDEGDDISTTLIKTRLKEIIDSEDKLQPYSDQKLSEMLTKEHKNIARRTVQKYREQMQIPSARMRKEI